VHEMMAGPGQSDAGCKPPQGAAVRGRGAERCGKGGLDPSGMVRKGGRKQTTDDVSKVEGRCRKQGNDSFPGRGWLTVRLPVEDGSLVARERGMPQGGVIRPPLASLFQHYAFDVWMRRNHPDIRFERYADDAICHCRSQAQALALRASLEKRFAECGLELHPGKTPRRAFYPRREWSLQGLADLINPSMRGWSNRYSRFRRSALGPVFSQVNDRLARWAIWTFKSFKRS
jgi:hypothetical protein